MDYMTGLASELAEVERRERVRAGEPERELANDSAKAASIVLADLMQTASLVVVVTSVFNGIESGAVPPTMQATTRTFLPRHGLLFADALGRLATDPAAVGAVQKMQEYCHAIDLASRLASPHFSGPDIHADDDRLARTASAWRGCCSLARAAVTGLADIAREEAISGQPSALRTLRGLLEAADGKTPALRPSGALVLPSWAERRQTSRRQMEEPAVVEWEGKRHPASILDRSASGARIRVEPQITAGKGDLLRLVQTGGETADAVVRWAAGGCLGLEYTTPARR